MLATGLAIGATTPDGDPLGPQELLLPGPAEGLPDQPVRPAARVGRPADVRDRPRARSRSASPAPTSRRTRPSSIHATADGRPQGQPRRLQPLRRAADGDRHRPRRPVGRAGAPLRRGAAAAAADDRRVRRGHGARPDAGRGERLAPAARHGAVRDPGRGQEHELVPLGRAGDRLRDRAPGRGARRRRDARPGDARLGRGPRHDVPDALQGGLATTTATSRSRTCRRSASTRPGSTRSGRRCRSCRPPAGRATRPSSACPAYDAAVLVARAATRRRCSRARAPPTRRSTAKAVANWVTGEYLGLLKTDRRRRRLGSTPRSWPTSSGWSATGELSRDERQGGLRGPRGDRRAGRRDRRRAAASARSRDAGALGTAVDEVIAANPAAVADYRAGKRRPSASSSAR